MTTSLVSEREKVVEYVFFLTPADGGLTVCCQCWHYFELIKIYLIFPSSLNSFCLHQTKAFTLRSFCARFSNADLILDNISCCWSTQHTFSAAEVLTAKPHRQQIIIPCCDFPRSLFSPLFSFPPVFCSLHHLVTFPPPQLQTCMTNEKGVRMGEKKTFHPFLLFLSSTLNELLWLCVGKPFERN